MDKCTLQALRRSLFFSRPEAAQWVAAGVDRPQGVTERAWRMWEDGSRIVPQDVADNIERIIAWRIDAIYTASDAVRQQSRKRDVTVSLVWYDTPDGWLSLPGRAHVMWRPQQSVCAAICAICPNIRMIPFDRELFDSWRREECGSEADSEALRGRWAASIPA